MACSARLWSIQAPRCCQESNGVCRLETKALGRGSLVLSPPGEIFGDWRGCKTRGRPGGCPAVAEKCGRSRKRVFLYLGLRAGPADLKIELGGGSSATP